MVDGGGGGNSTLGTRQLKIVYVLSSGFDYSSLIWPGDGPPVAASFGWETASIAGLPILNCDLAIIDHLLVDADIPILRSFLQSAAEKRFPVFFRLTDPEMPLRRNSPEYFPFTCRDMQGVHYISLYQPSGPLKDFLDALCVSRWAVLPLAYDARREVNRPMNGRFRQIFLSGARDARVYPGRFAIQQLVSSVGLIRHLVTDLPHPGYNQDGEPLKHAVIGQTYVDFASRYTHFFVCPSCYDVELMKYLECAYAGCVPIGRNCSTLEAHAGECFVTLDYTPKAVAAILRDDDGTLGGMADRYRRKMRELRDPFRLEEHFIKQVRSIPGLALSAH